MATKVTDFDDDFGFTFTSESELAEPHKETGEALSERLQQMYDAIIPLLKNLRANPDQEYIKWPNRTAKIDQFKKKLDSIGGEFLITKQL
ncbi:hypothetical protein EBT25_10670 [bacterium]|nr:hypothetical protein [bacterium]